MKRAWQYLMDARVAIRAADTAYCAEQRQYLECENLVNEAMSVGLAECERLRAELASRGAGTPPEVDVEGHCSSDGYIVRVGGYAVGWWSDRSDADDATRDLRNALAALWPSAPAPSPEGEAPPTKELLQTFASELAALKALLVSPVSEAERCVLDAARTWLSPPCGYRHEAFGHRLHDAVDALLAAEKASKTAAVESGIPSAVHTSRRAESPQEPGAIPVRDAEALTGGGDSSADAASPNRGCNSPDGGTLAVWPDDPMHPPGEPVRPCARCGGDGTEPENPAPNPFDAGMRRAVAIPWVAPAGQPMAKPEPQRTRDPVDVVRELGCCGKVWDGLVCVQPQGHEGPCVVTLLPKGHAEAVRAAAGTTPTASSDAKPPTDPSELVYLDGQYEETGTWTGRIGDVAVDLVCHDKSTAEREVTRLRQTIAAHVEAKCAEARRAALGECIRVCETGEFMATEASEAWATQKPSSARNNGVNYQEGRIEEARTIGRRIKALRDGGGE